MYLGLFPGVRIFPVGHRLQPLDVPRRVVPDVERAPRNSPQRGQPVRGPVEVAQLLRVGVDGPGLELEGREWALERRAEAQEAAVVEREAAHRSVLALRGL